MIEKGNEVIIKDNLADVMTVLGFDKGCIKAFCKRFVGTTQKVYDVWTDRESSQEYATVEICCEVPIQCCELIK